jgi:CPA1 family monovalent cation:H+ antiporter
MRAEDQEETVDYLRGWGQRRAQAAWERLGVTDENRETPAVTFRRLRVEMLAAERRVVVDVRRSGAVAHEVAEQVLHRLDQEEALLVGFSEPAPAPATTLVAPAGADLCAHLAAAAAVAVPRSTEGCPACLELGERSWVHLRMCLTCGNVGCCDSSPHRHAEAHYRSTGHPVMRSIELGEAWRWCYPDSRVG